LGGSHSAFFLIADPMTLPDHPAARRIHVSPDTVAAFTRQFLFYRPIGALWVLLCLASLVLP